MVQSQGTVVDWRSTVTNGLLEAAENTLNSATSSIPSSVRSRAISMSVEEWGTFSQEWRNAYMKYTMSRALDPNLPVVTIDEHHLDSLQTLLKAWSLEGLWDTEQVKAISLIWPKLVPWPDSERGLRALSSQYRTCTLSNGNFSLLRDLKAFGSLDFTHIFSAEEFSTFKPNHAIYLGAAQKLGIPPSQCAMVAAHLGDLKAAKACGYSTIYVERPREEKWSEIQIQEAKNEGWVDVWIREDEDGFVALDRKLREQGQL
jgi:2-haloacid dehalogenase